MVQDELSISRQPQFNQFLNLKLHTSTLNLIDFCTNETLPALFPLLSFNPTALPRGLGQKDRKHTHTRAELSGRMWHQQAQTIKGAKGASFPKSLCPQSISWEWKSNRQQLMMSANEQKQYAFWKPNTLGLTLSSLKHRFLLHMAKRPYTYIYNGIMKKKKNLTQKS